MTSLQQPQTAIGAVIEGNVTPVVVVPEKQPVPDGGTTVVVNPPAPAPAPTQPHTLPQTQPGVNLP